MENIGRSYTYPSDKINFQNEGKKISDKNTVHKITVLSRKNFGATGVKEMIEFDSKIVEFSTVMGRMLVKGKELHVTRLNLEKGELDIEGAIDGISYEENQDKESFLKRLFK